MTDIRIPLDRAAMVSSVKKTARLITIEEGCRRGGVGA
jgi:pyruvate/2-oxoglutarate/acetoin dehydrogenase E1 component